MRTRDKLGALIGAGLLTVALGSTAFAVAPTYTLTVQKAATPSAVGVGGANVLFTVTVNNTGTGSFAVVNVTDSIGGCTLSAPSGTGAPTTLAGGDSWTYTCTVTGVAPDTTNTATVYACHNNGAGCNQSGHDATGVGSVTVTLDTEASVPPSASPDASISPEPSVNPSASPVGTGVGDTNQPTIAPTNSALDGGTGPADGAWLMVIALGVLLASMVILTPARAKHRS